MRQAQFQAQQQRRSVEHVEATITYLKKTLSYMTPDALDPLLATQASSALGNNFFPSLSPPKDSLMVRQKINSQISAALRERDQLLERHAASQALADAESCSTVRDQVEDMLQLIADQTHANQRLA